MLIKNKSLIKINKMLLDPPRTGAKECIALITKIRPEKIVYVSCNPATLARDVEIIIAAGYSLDAAGIMDMFPHTTHIESMVSFTRLS